MQEYWYPWVPSRYRADTLHLTPLEDGVYRRLIDHYMETKLPLPDNEVALARIAGLPVAEFRQLSGSVLAFFKRENGLLKSKRCDEVLRDQAERSEKHRAKSAAGGKAKAEKYNNINANPATGKPQAVPNPATRQDKTEQKRIDTNVSIASAVFDEAWSLYPKQRIGSRPKAFAAWQAALSRKHSEQSILTGVKHYATSDEVVRGYAKGFAAWLNDDRFLNDYSTVAKPSGSAARGNRGFDALAVAAGKVQENVEAVDLRSLSKTNPALYLQRMLDKSRGGNNLEGSTHAAIDHKPDASPVGIGNGEKS